MSPSDKFSNFPLFQTRSLDIPPETNLRVFKMNRTKVILPSILALSLASTTLFAQELNVQNFKPIAGPHGIVTVEGSNTVGHLVPTGNLVLNYSSLSLVRENSEGRVTPIVDQQLAIHAVAGIGLSDFLQLDLGLPIYLVNEGTKLSGEGFDELGIGDLSVRPKANFISSQDGGFGLGMLVDFSIPSGDSGTFTGGGFAVTPKLLVDYKVGDFLMAANLGASIRETATIDNLDQGSAFEYGVGGQYSLLNGLFLIEGELFGRSSFDDFFASDDSPLEGILGAKLVTSSGFQVFAGSGGGLISGAGAPAFRAYVGMGYAQRSNDFDGDGIANKVDACIDIPEDSDGFEDEDGCPDEDNDQDQILDLDDKCPDLAEDLDGFEDEDGCPDEDNDVDGILDAEDKCPNEPEDKNNFEDGDGCPDGETDSDGDGIKDAVDKCREKPEDKDGFQDEDGCPDTDNDSDGILDKDDKCPNKPGLAANNGCPAEKPRAVLNEKEIQILEKVFFENDKAIIKSDSYPLLNEVGLILRTNPSVKVEIGGHSDDKGKDEYNLQLSRARAKSVEVYLTNKGVKAAQLTSVGYGETKPLDPKKTNAARAKNRRVEFKILKNDSKIEIKTK